MPRKLPFLRKNKKEQVERPALFVDEIVRKLT